MLALALTATIPLFGADPILVVSRPSICPDAVRSTCESFDQALAHPAMQRRLREIVLVKAENDGVPFIAALTPSGVEVTRWVGWRDEIALSTIVTRMTRTADRLREADAALSANDADLAIRHWALATLEFGDGERGRLLLEALSHSESLENRQLAAIWLERFNSRGSAAPPCEEVYSRHVREATSDLVRFEALMGIGSLRAGRGLDEQAASAYSNALAIAPDADSRRAATAAYEHAISAMPVLGIGRAGDVVAGRRSVQLRRVPPATASVEFTLDGVSVSRAKTPPFLATIDFGRTPSRRVLDAIARNRSGSVIDRTRVVVNERSEAFAVEITAPEGASFSGTVEVIASARVPRGRRMRELAIEWNGKVMARFRKPPFRTRIEVRDFEQGILRAVLRLDDGSEVEDARLVNSAGSIESEAHLIELPAYFDGPVPATRELRLRENRIVRPVERIIPPAEAPLEIALLLDTSGSMRAHMLDLQEAAVRFVEQHVGTRDRIMLVPFDSQARVVLRPTSDAAAVIDEILSLEAGGTTALHDAIITSLLQLQTTGTRRALIVFSDGLDASSVFASRDVAEVARRAGVPIYALAFVHPVPPQVQVPGTRLRPDPAATAIAVARQGLVNLSRDSGGLAFELRSLGKLQSHWDAIGADLARQSLVVYRAAESGPEWRPLELSLPRKGRVRAPAGAWVIAKAP